MPIAISTGRRNVGPEQALQARQQQRQFDSEMAMKQYAMKLQAAQDAQRLALQQQQMRQQAAQQAQGNWMDLQRMGLQNQQFNVEQNRVGNQFNVEQQRLRDNADMAAFARNEELGIRREAQAALDEYRKMQAEEAKRRTELLNEQAMARNAIMMERYGASGEAAKATAAGKTKAEMMDAVGYLEKYYREQQAALGAAGANVPKDEASQRRYMELMDKAGQINDSYWKRRQEDPAGLAQDMQDFLTDVNYSQFVQPKASGGDDAALSQYSGTPKPQTPSPLPQQPAAPQVPQQQAPQTNFDKAKVMVNQWTQNSKRLTPEGGIIYRKWARELQKLQSSPLANSKIGEERALQIMEQLGQFDVQQYVHQNGEMVGDVVQNPDGTITERTAEGMRHIGFVDEKAGMNAFKKSTVELPSGYVMGREPKTGAWKSIIEPMPQKGEDPQAMREKAAQEAEMTWQKHKGELQFAQLKNTLDAQAQQQKMQIEREKAQLAQQVAEDKARRDAATAEHNAQIAAKQAEVDAQVKAKDAEAKRANFQTKHDSVNLKRGEMGLDPIEITPSQPKDTQKQSSEWNAYAESLMQKPAYREFIDSQEPIQLQHGETTKLQDGRVYSLTAAGVTKKYLSLGGKLHEVTGQAAPKDAMFSPEIQAPQDQMRRSAY